MMFFCHTLKKNWRAHAAQRADTAATRRGQPPYEIAMGQRPQRAEGERSMNRRGFFKAAAAAPVVASGVMNEAVSAPIGDFKIKGNAMMYAINGQANYAINRSAPMPVSKIDEFLAEHGEYGALRAAYHMGLISFDDVMTYFRKEDDAGHERRVRTEILSYRSFSRSTKERMCCDSSYRYRTERLLAQNQENKNIFGSSAFLYALLQKVLP